MDGNGRCVDHGRIIWRADDEDVGIKLEEVGVAATVLITAILT